MNAQKIQWLDVFALADCAARTFAENRTSKHLDDPKFRQYLRSEPTRALRALWKSGSPEERVTVAARVAVWMHRPVQEIMRRVNAREQDDFIVITFFAVWGLAMLFFGSVPMTTKPPKRK